MIIMLEVQFQKTLWRCTLDISFKINDGILVLWGPSGAGKSTVLHCLAGLQNPSSGFIKLNNRIWFSSDEKINIYPRFRNVGYLFQDFALFPHMTVRKNVMYGLKAKKQRESDLCKNLHEFLDSFGVRHLMDRYPGQLSGGEKQRVALARALAVQPDLLLLDEPFSSLDKNTKCSLRKEIKVLHEKWKIPFVLVTHDEDDVRFFGEQVLSLDGSLTKVKNTYGKNDLN